MNGLGALTETTATTGTILATGATYGWESANSWVFSVT